MLAGREDSGAEMKSSRASKGSAAGLLEDVLASFGGGAREVDWPRESQSALEDQASPCWEPEFEVMLLVPSCDAFCLSAMEAFTFEAEAGVPKEDRRDEKASSAALVTAAGFAAAATVGLGIVGEGEAEDEGSDLVRASKLYDEYCFDAAAVFATCV